MERKNSHKYRSVKSRYISRWIRLNLQPLAALGQRESIVPVLSMTNHILFRIASSEN